jgi:hypothetical protein
MAGPARSDLNETLAELLSRKRREMGRVVPGAGSAGRQPYDAGFRMGEPMPSGGQGFGVRGVGGGAVPVARRMAPAAGRPVPANLRSTTPLAQAAWAKLQPWLSRLDRSDVAKGVAGEMARQAAIVPGMARSVLHTAEDLKDTAVFAGRLMDSEDGRKRPNGISAREEVADGARALAGYARSRVAHPEMAVGDIKEGWHRFRLKNDPTATPQADTFLGEVVRKGTIGLNQGETAGDIGQLIFGGAELKPLSRIGRFSREAQEAKFLARGLPADVAREMAEPYNGMGHHYLPRRTRLPAILGGGPIPSVLSESPFFLLRPRGLSKGEFHQLHFQVDPHFYGGKLPGDVRWSGNKLGWAKRGPVGRVWYGMPKPLKAPIVGPPTAVAAADLVRERRERK